MLKKLKHFLAWPALLVLLSGCSQMTVSRSVTNEIVAAHEARFMIQALDPMAEHSQEFELISRVFTNELLAHGLKADTKTPTLLFLVGSATELGPTESWRANPSPATGWNMRTGTWDRTLFIYGYEIGRAHV
jgi:hypothetical protein